MKKLSIIALSTLMAFNAYAVKGELDVTTAHGSVSNGYPDSSIQTFRGLFTFTPSTKLGLSLTKVDAWGSSALVSSGRLVHDFSDRLQLDLNVTTSDKSDVVVKDRFNAMVKTKVLPARNLILGLGVDSYSMRSGGKAKSVTTEAIYYVPNMPVVLQGNATFTQSDSKFGNSRSGNRFGGAVTYGRVGDWTAAVSASSGRVNYESSVFKNATADYNSTTVGVSARIWITPEFGVSLGANSVNNKYYDRKEGSVGVFYSF